MPKWMGYIVLIVIIWNRAENHIWVQILTDLLPKPPHLQGQNMHRNWEVIDKEADSNVAAGYSVYACPLLLQIDPSIMVAVTWSIHVECSAKMAGWTSEGLHRRPIVCTHTVRCKALWPNGLLRLGGGKLFKVCIEILSFQIKLSRSGP